MSQIRINKDGKKVIMDGNRWRAAVDVECTQCGKVFTAPVRHVNPRRFCSPECAAKEHRKYWGRKQTGGHCVICDMPFTNDNGRKYRTCRRPYCVRANNKLKARTQPRNKGKFVVE